MTPKSHPRTTREFFEKEKENGGTEVDKRTRTSILGLSSACPPGKSAWRTATCICGRWPTPLYRKPIDTLRNGFPVELLDAPSLLRVGDLTPSHCWRELTGDHDYSTSTFICPLNCTRHTRCTVSAWKTISLSSSWGQSRPGYGWGHVAIGRSTEGGPTAKGQRGIWGFLQRSCPVRPSLGPPPPFLCARSAQPFGCGDLCPPTPLPLAHSPGGGACCRQSPCLRRLCGPRLSRCPSPARGGKRRGAARSLHYLPWTLLRPVGSRCFSSISSRAVSSCWIRTRFLNLAASLMVWWMKYFCTSRGPLTSSRSLNIVS